MAWELLTLALAGRDVHTPKPSDLLLAETELSFFFFFPFSFIQGSSSILSKDSKVPFFIFVARFPPWPEERDGQGRSILWINRIIF